jgi:hypothetical protein
MPYTPPSRSPATSNPNSPILTRNHSYEVSHSQANRPGLPRSRSATYLQKHRRTPSISDHQAPSHHVPNSMITERSHGGQIDEPKSPLPIAEAILSPIESPIFSDDDEERGRGRQLRDLAESLKETMLVPKAKGHSPTRKEEDSQPAAPKSTPAPLSNAASSPALTPQAIKIAHSRSSSEIQLSKLADVPSQAASSDDSDDDDDGLMFKPPLLRKKSGELVKPALRASSRRPSSMPGTPTFSKAVHFNEDIEQVRHFLKVDRPIAVSAGSSPVETYDSEGEYPFGYDDGYKSSVVDWEIRTANFPRDTFERQHNPVRVEKIFLASDKKTLVGVVACANIAFQKYVVARFTLDYWKTTSEVVCEYNNDIRRKQSNDGYDRFNFNIKLSDQAHLETKTLLLCVRFSVNGQDHWDNNGNMNYQVDFIKKSTPRVARQGSNAGTLGAIPRSRHSPTSTRPRSFPAANDDDFASSFEFGNTTTLLKEPQMPASYRTRTGRKSSIFPPQSRKNQQSGAFATRYDFGASLSAALTHAQVELGGKKTTPLPASDDYFTKPNGKLAAPAVQPVDGPSPAKSVSSGRPELGSQEYHDLIQKFCYFGSKQGSPGAMSPDPNGPRSVPSAPNQTTTQADAPFKGSIDAMIDSGSDQSGSSSARSSATNSPPSPRLDKVQYDGAQDSHRTSRSSTPTFHTTSPRLLAQYRSPSPALYELPHQVLAQ